MLKKEINFLLLTDGERSHFCLINSFQSFMRQKCGSNKKSLKARKTTFWANRIQSVSKSNLKDYFRVVGMRRELNFSDWIAISWNRNEILLQTRNPKFKFRCLCWFASPPWSRTKNLGFASMVLESQILASWWATLVDSRSITICKKSIYRGEKTVSTDCSKVRTAFDFQ